MKNISLAYRLFQRNWQAGTLTVLLVALIVAITSMTTVGFFADRVDAALRLQANEMIAADVVAISARPLRPFFREEAAQRALQVAEAVTFPSMVSGDVGLGQGMRLSEIKAVSHLFPLRGKLRISPGMGQADVEAEGVPQPGTAWAAESLMNSINAKVGDDVAVGAIKLKIAAVLTREPDSVLDYSAIAPRVLMNLEDVGKTQLIQEGSRITYRFMVAGERQAIADYRAALATKLQPGERLESVLDSRSEVRSSLDRAHRFLGLATLLAVILASVAVALAARRFSQKQLDSAAMMRCLGATQATIFALHVWQFVMLGLLACIIGIIGGYIAQLGLATILAGLFTVSLPAPGYLPALQGLLIGLVLLLGFTLPPLLQLRKVPTLRVLRRDLDPFDAGSAMAYLFGVLALLALFIWQAGDVMLGVWAALGFGITLIVAALAGGGLMRIAAGLPHITQTSGRWSIFWRHGLASMRRRFAGSLVQVMGLGLGIMALLLLSLVRTDMIANWQREVSDTAPNRFIINIQQHQLRDVQDFFGQHGMQTPTLYPMIRARLVAINAHALPQYNPLQEQAEAATQNGARASGKSGQNAGPRMPGREWNLSWTRTLHTGNKVVKGKFWAADQPFAAGEGEFSVEESVAMRMNIKVGDRLTFDIAGTQFTARVSNLRKVVWESFSPNFFVIASPGVLENYPTSYITSLKTTANQGLLLNQLVRQFPNLTVIDLGAIMEQVRRITDQVSNAISYVFLFTLAAGLVVLYAAISSSQDERIFDAAIMRTLGASRQQVRMLQLAEFLTIGLLAGAIATAGALGLGWLLAEMVLDIPYTLNLAIPLIGMLGGGFGVALAGLIGTRKAVDSPPLATIRSLA